MYPKLQCGSTESRPTMEFAAPRSLANVSVVGLPKCPDWVAHIARVAFIARIARITRPNISVRRSLGSEVTPAFAREDERVRVAIP